MVDTQRADRATTDDPAAADIDPLEFRRVLSHFPTGVAVIAGIGSEGRAIGLTVGSFFSVSLAPPLVGMCVAKSSTSWPAIRAAGSFRVNVLADDQRHVCAAFAKSGADKFAEVPWDAKASVNPRIHNVLAWVDCEIVDIHDAGDHEICVGRVRALEVERDALPLVFFRGEFR